MVIERGLSKSRISRDFSNKCHFRQWIFVGRLVLICWFSPSQWLSINHKRKEQRYNSRSLQRKYICCWKQAWMYSVTMWKPNAETLTGPVNSVGYFYFYFIMKRKTLLAACVPAALGNFGSQHVPRGSTAAQVQGQGGQAVFRARWLLGCSAGHLSAWNCTEIAYRCLQQKSCKSCSVEMSQNSSRQSLLERSMHLVHPQTLLQKSILS